TLPAPGRSQAATPTPLSPGVDEWLGEVGAVAGLPPFFPFVKAKTMLTAAEFKTIREHLGIPGDWLARRFGVSGRSVRHWDSGKYPVPGRISRWMRWWAEDAEATVAWITERLATSPESERLLVTYRNDAELDAGAADDPHRGLYPDDDLPAAWHRRMAARVAERVPGLRL